MQAYKVKLSNCVRSSEAGGSSALARKIPVSGIDIKSIISDLMRFLGTKQKLIVLSRFGVGGREPQTLEAIGRSLDITRERVRQIEADAVNFLKKIKKTSEIEELLELVGKTVREKGGIVRAEVLLKEVFSEYFSKNNFSIEEGRMLEVILAVAGLARIKGNRELEDCFIGKDFNRKYFREVLVKMEDLFNGSKKLYSSDEVKKMFESLNLFEKYPDCNADQALNFLDVSKKFGRNVFGSWGKARWPLIRPRGVREKAMLVFLKEKKPLHFREVSRLIKSYGLSSKKVHPQTVHNELIRDKNFVLVGRGIYALRDWGYEEGTVKDVIASVVKQAGGFLQKNKIISELLRKRKVKKATIMVNLSDKKLFKKVGNGYKIKEK